MCIARSTCSAAHTLRRPHTMRLCPSSSTDCSQSRARSSSVANTCIAAGMRPFLLTAPGRKQAADRGRAGGVVVVLCGQPANGHEFQMWSQAAPSMGPGRPCGLSLPRSDAYMCWPAKSVSDASACIVRRTRCSACSMQIAATALAALSPVPGWPQVLQHL